MSEALFISGDNTELGETNSSLFRIGIPAEFLKRAGHTIHLQNTPPTILNGQWVDTLSLEHIPDVVLVERIISPERVKMLRLSGAKRIGLTFDDNYQLLPANTQTAGYWRVHMDEWLSALPLVDFVIVPSQQLVADFRSHRSDIQVVANYHDAALWEGSTESHDGLVLGWGGSMQHVQSWTNSNVIPALIKLLERHPQWKLHIHGFTARNELTQAGLKHELKPWANLGIWAKSVRGFDIGLAPLHGPYDARRSNLKVLEYGLAGVPYVATRAAPYTEAFSPGGLLVDKPSTWVPTLEELMCNTPKRKTLGELGRNWAQAYTMDKAVEVYEKILWP